MNNFCVMKVVKESYGSIFCNLEKILPIFLQFVLLSALFTVGFYTLVGPDLFKHLAAPHEQLKTFQVGQLAFSLLELLIYWAVVPVFVAVVRNVAIGEAYSANYFPRLIASRELKVLFMPTLVYLGLILAMLLVMIGGIMLAAFLGHSLGFPKLIPIITGVVLALVAFYILMRFSLMAALFSLDTSNSISASLSLTKGHVWKIFGTSVLVILPFILLLMISIIIAGVFMGVMHAGISFAAIVMGLVALVVYMLMLLLSAATMGIITRELAGLGSKKKK